MIPAKVKTYFCRGWLGMEASGFAGDSMQENATTLHSFLTTQASLR
jgi:hypothetical protein